jgi:hypothetical protein
LPIKYKFILNQLPRSLRCMRWECFVSLPNLKLNLVGVGGQPTYMSSMRIQRGENTMHSLLAVGLLITLCAPASATTARHHRHFIVRPSLGYVIPGWAYQAVRPPIHYDDTPSYDDPSKYGGGTAL